MLKSLIRKFVIVAVIAVIVLSSVLMVQSISGSATTAYNVPRLLGMEGEGEGVAQLSGPPTTDIQGPFFETHGAPVSLDMDLRDLPQTSPEHKRPMREIGHPPMSPMDSDPDPVVQSDDRVGKLPTGPLAVAPAPLMNFAGLDFAADGAGWPPDTHGDVGPNHYIQAVNTSIGIYSKTTGAELVHLPFDTFFSNNGGSGMCATYNNGDPIVVYDQISGRWIITDFAWSNIMSGPYYECIAVSKTADPVSGGWWLYTFVADNVALNDYPKLGIWSDGIYMSANMFDCLDAGCNSANYTGTKVWALNRDDLISGAVLRSISFTLGSSYFSLLPANLKGALPPANTPEYFLSDWYSTTSIKMWKFTSNWGTPASSTFTGPTNISIASLSWPSVDVPQKNSAEMVDTLGDRLMTWLQYRNIGGTESLWVSRTAQVSSYTGIRWTEIRNMSATPTVYQQGTYAPDSNFRWMPSIAVNGHGDMAIGYSVSSSTMFPAIRYAGRLVTDPLNTLGMTENTLIAGTGSQNGGYGRWGDYSSMSVDPVDDCTFWYTTEYFSATGSNWQTRIGSFKLAECGPVDYAPTATLTNPIENAMVSGVVSVEATATDDDAVTQVEFFVDGSSIGVDSNSADGWSASWDTTGDSDGSHTLTATATDTAAQTGSDSYNVFVNNGTLPAVHIGDLDAGKLVRRSSWRPSITLTVHDQNHAIVRAATVYFSWSGGYVRSAYCRTNFRGQCKVSAPLLSIGITSVTFNITNIVKVGFVYNPAANHDPEADSDGTTITVTYP